MEDKVVYKKDEINGPFTFVVINDQVPAIKINGKELHLVSCAYHWVTASAEDEGTTIVVAMGYLEGDRYARTYRLNFKTQHAVQI